MTPDLVALIVPRMALTFGPPKEAVRSAIDAMVLPPAAKAGLWLLHDFFEESHAISQDLHTPEGSYWHAIVHRREPDAFNAKYWFSRVGTHAVMKQLKAGAPSLGYDYRNAAAFVDDCERVRGTAEETMAAAVQFRECQLLLEHCVN